jgi:hypothetical protein
MKINKEELYKLYMEWVDKVAEECDWKTSFTPEEIVEAISTILENNPQLCTNNEKKIKMDKEHPLTNTLINLKDFMEDLSNYDAPESSDGWSLSNLPSHFWQTLGECISDIEDYIKNK